MKTKRQKDRLQPASGALRKTWSTSESLMLTTGMSLSAPASGSKKCLTKTAKKLIIKFLPSIFTIIAIIVFYDVLLFTFWITVEAA